MAPVTSRQRSQRSAAISSASQSLRATRIGIAVAASATRHGASITKSLAQVFW